MSSGRSVAPSEGPRLPALLAAVGLLFSGLLEVAHLRAYLDTAGNSYCSASETFDCVKVALSASAVQLGIPLPIWGIVGFGALLAAALRRSILLLPLSGLAAAASVLLLVVELTNIGAVCLLCEVVHVVSWLLFAATLRARKTLVRDERNGTTLYLCVGLPLTLLVGARLFVPNYWDSFTYRSPIPYASGKTPEGHEWIGSERPSVTLDEFVDYRCPHCKVASARTLRLLAKRPDLRIVRRHSPRMRCETDAACGALRLALCASDQGKFWPADRWLFAHYEPRVDLDPAALARDLALDEPRLLACYRAPETLARADALAKEAIRRRVIDTPTYYRDGKKLRPEQAAELLR